MKGIYWLASFPKSGNTWTRSFLANLLRKADDPVGINQLSTGAIGSSREWVEDGLGIDISEFSHEEVDRLRPLAYKQLARRGTGGYHKIHDAYSYLDYSADRKPMIPKNTVRAAVYLVRHPLDVAISYANHSSVEIEIAVQWLCQSEHAMCQSKRAQSNQLRQLLYTWSEHAASWIEADIPRLVVRYEDLKANPVKQFTEISNMFDIECTHDEIVAAEEKCQFDKLQKQENDKGFGEKAAKVKNFFRKGIVGDWQSVLNEDQISRIIEANSKYMSKLGYIDAKGDPLVDPLPVDSSVIINTKNKYGSKVRHSK